jgi:hypothetical protein
MTRGICTLWFLPAALLWTGLATAGGAEAAASAGATDGASAAGAAETGRTRTMTAGDSLPWSIAADTSGFGVEDLYKLLHQAWRGPGHAIPSPEAAAAYLASEWETLGPPREDERILEILAAEAPYVRIHLRPYRAAGGTQQMLLRAFLGSDRSREPSRATADSAAFVQAWKEAGRLIGNGTIRLPLQAYISLDAEAAAAGYPAVHHSEAYEKQRQPAYRVVSRDEARALLEHLER